MSAQDEFWIETVAPDRADGDVRREYDAALRRAGRVWNIVRVMSPNPATLRAAMAFYSTILFGPSGLSRIQREALATITSKANDCHY